MESQHTQEQLLPNGDHQDGDGSPVRGKISARWAPTVDHVRILKDLYFISGVRSPTTDQIQRIASRLRQFGKIEAKNVFYWFQNQKARERNKKRFTPSLVPPLPTLHKQKGPKGGGKHQNSCSSGADPRATPHGMLRFGQIDTSGGSYNPALAMENTFRGCSISAQPGHDVFGGWVGINPYTSSYTFFENQRSSVYELSSERLEGAARAGWTPVIETLPLFPMNGGNDGIYKLLNSHHDTDNDTDSLELSLGPRHSEEIALNSRAD